jgi:hypothetical protein
MMRSGKPADQLDMSVSDNRNVSALQADNRNVSALQADNRSKSEDDLPPLAFVKRQEKGGGAGAGGGRSAERRRHSADDRARKGLAPPEVAAEADNLNRRTRDETPSSTCSGESQVGRQFFLE